MRAPCILPEGFSFHVWVTHLVAGLQVSPTCGYQRVVHVEDERREVFKAIIGILVNLGRHPDFRLDTVWGTTKESRVHQDVPGAVRTRFRAIVVGSK